MLINYINKISINLQFLILKYFSLFSIDFFFLFNLNCQESLFLSKNFKNSESKGICDFNTLLHS